MKQEGEIVSLASMNDGAAIEAFDAELQRALDNILDPATPATAKRRIVLTVTIQPRDEKREITNVTIDASSKLPAAAPCATVLYVGRHKGKAVATEHNPKQAGLFDDPTEQQATGPLGAVRGGKE